MRLFLGQVGDSRSVCFRFALAGRTAGKGDELKGSNAGRSVRVFSVGSNDFIGEEEAILEIETCVVSRVVLGPSRVDRVVRRPRRWRSGTKRSRSGDVDRLQSVISV